MRFALSPALLLVLPIGWLLWRYARRRGLPQLLRAVALASLILALAQPSVRLPSAGSDVVILVDRSASMPPGSEAHAQELVALVEQERRSGDRVAVVGFGTRAEVEQPPTESARFPGFIRTIDADGSNLAEALERAAQLIPPERRGAVLVVSDGEATGGDLGAEAQRLAARGLPVSFRILARSPPPLDVAVLSLDLPSAVAEHEPFQFSTVVHASQSVRATIRLERNGRVLTEGAREMGPGENVLLFRDRIGSSGLSRYRLTVHADGDGRPENDAGDAVLRVSGPEHLLLISRPGASAVSRALTEGGMVVRRQNPGPVTLAQLEGTAAVILENVEAEALGEGGLGAIAHFVQEGGGGLVMTGGRRSFGEGGYRRSPVEEVLPVTLEVRQEQRRSSLAMSIVMDCSGSMSARLPDGRTKMQAAGEGAVAALTLLGPQDEASVHLVDTVPHEIFPLQPVTSDLPLDRVARGYSGGGGILVGVALRNARDVILSSNKPTRHIVLFADASDSTDPDDYKKVLAELRQQQVTVSVIGMGKPTDGDAPLLREVAALGGGRIYFAENMASLPRVFSQETLTVARASFVDTKVGVKWTADLALLGVMEQRPGLTVGGYNLAYARPGASVGLRADDSNKAPLLAFRPAGFGRAVAFTAEADGAYTGELRIWAGYAGLLNQMVRWTLPSRSGDEPNWTARVVREGGDLHVTVDFPEGVPPPDPPPSVVLLAEGQSPAPAVPLRWESEGRVGVRLPIQGHEVIYPVVRLGPKALRLPPVTRAYSPEFAPVRPGTGRSNLSALATTTGGKERTSVAGLFRESPESAGEVKLTPELVMLALAAIVLEVYARRMLLRRLTRVAGRAVPAPGGMVSAPPIPGMPPPTALQAPEPARGVDAALEAARRRIKDRR